MKMLQSVGQTPIKNFPHNIFSMKKKGVTKQELTFSGEGDVPNIDDLTDSDVKTLLGSLIPNAGQISPNPYHICESICEATSKRAYPTKTRAYYMQWFLNKRLEQVHQDPYKCKYCSMYHLGTIKTKQRFDEVTRRWDTLPPRSRIPSNKEALILFEESRGRGYYQRLFSPGMNYLRDAHSGINELIRRFLAGELDSQQNILEEASPLPTLVDTAQKEHKVTRGNTRHIDPQEQSKARNIIQNMRKQKTPPHYLVLLEAYFIHGEFCLPRRFLDLRAFHLTAEILSHLDENHPHFIVDNIATGEDIEEAKRGLYTRLRRDSSVTELEQLVFLLTGRFLKLSAKKEDQNDSFLNKAYATYLETSMVHDAQEKRRATLEASFRIGRMTTKDFENFDAQWKQDNPCWLSVPLPAMRVVEKTHHFPMHEVLRAAL